MAIEALGNSLTSATGEVSRSNLSQNDFIKLFMTELTFQDPLEPINNREFLAQMAQFTNLEQARLTNENISNLVSINATLQSLSIIGKQVEIVTDSGSNITGTVSAVNFSQDGSLINVKQADGSFLTNIKMSQIKTVR
ncbi:flagellar hook capping protein [Acinetobacter sp. AG1]|uniref:flagellar hook capping FlgD N-terminal domain-containing protein n=1 Tax=Acinetobacter TaxID=469 RepID=UPI0006291301|nr:flagellar hook capping FlgD N-terminal domain-containing protein [Acinetobacter sp. AG1]KKW81786.1 flagellar hook capping protein [Acinetobacter sp. AG1]